MAPASGMQVPNLSLIEDILFCSWDNRQEYCPSNGLFCAFLRNTSYSNSDLNAYRNTQVEKSNEMLLWCGHGFPRDLPWVRCIHGCILYLFSRVSWELSQPMGEDCVFWEQGVVRETRTGLKTYWYAPLFPWCLCFMHQFYALVLFHRKSISDWGLGSLDNLLGEL